MTHPTTPPPTLKAQEIPFDDPRSACFFLPSGNLLDRAEEKPCLATPAAVETYGLDTIIDCLARLQRLADEHDGIDYLQVFMDPTKPEPLWFIEDGPGGAITALLPSDY